MHKVFVRFKERFATRGGLDFPRELDDKLLAYKYMDALEVRRPNIYGIYNSVDEFKKTVKELPARVVLKPNGFASAKGVYLLEKAGEHYYDHFSCQIKTLEEVLSSYIELEEKSKASDKIIEFSIIAEEFIEPAVKTNIIPMDYKFMTHHGEVFAIIQFNRNTRPVSYSFFDANFQPLCPNLQHDFKGREFQHIVPVHAEEMLRNAKKISKSLATPFVRVDMFDGVNGACFGELTPAPGNFTIRNGENITPYPYKGEVLDEFERLWVDAESRIKKEQISFPVVNRLSLDELCEYFNSEYAFANSDIPNFEEISRLQARALMSDAFAATKLSSIYGDLAKGNKNYLLIALAWEKISLGCIKPSAVCRERIASLTERCEKASLLSSNKSEQLYNQARSHYEQIQDKSDWILLRLALMHFKGKGFITDLPDLEWATSTLYDLRGRGSKSAASFIEKNDL